MTNQQISESIADLIHQTFKHGRGVQDISGIIGASQTSDHIRHELMTCAVQLKRSDLNKEIVSKVDANVRTANVTGLMTDDTYNKIQELLGELSYEPRSN